MTNENQNQDQDKDKEDEKRKSLPKWPRQPHLEAFISEGNAQPYDTTEIVKAEGKDWWKYGENGQPYDDEFDPEDI